MDPLSVTASIIAIVTLAGQTCKAITDLHLTCKKLPGRLHALRNEIEDFRAVIMEIQVATDDHASLRIRPHDHFRIPGLVKQAEAKLQELKDILAQLNTACATSRIPLAKARAWHKVQEKLFDSQEEIKKIRSNLNLMLGASNSRDMTRIRLDLEALTMTTSRSTQDQIAQRDDILDGFARQDQGFEQVYQRVDRVDQRISNIEAIMETQEARLIASQQAQLGPFLPPIPRWRRSSRPKHQGEGDEAKMPDAHPEAIGVRVTRPANVCRPTCRCACHSQGRAVTPALVNRVLGQLFVGYAGLPVVSPRCDLDTCRKSQAPQISLEYWFPLGIFWSQIIRLQAGYQSLIGPQMSLSTLRQVSDSAPCVDFALNGNIAGLKDLFIRGQASPRDVSTTRGYSLLRWALYGKQYETCKFLLHEGADPGYRPIARHDNSPRNKANDFLLQGGLSKEAMDTLKCITEGGDWVEEQDYTLIHEVVLGFSGKSLEEAILQHPDDVDTTDALGRTPLLWAAARGDDRSVITLLANGADPNIMDIQFSGPLSYAADRGYATCVRILLEAGADPDPDVPSGVKVGSPLNCASRNATDPLVIKNLLDFDADIEASGIDGKTPLIHVARTDNVSFALLLLERGASINATCAAGQTPLTAAITFNSHGVLQLLLDRWFEYSECPRLKGPHLLPLVATYADLETVNILIATDHLKLKYDKNYTAVNSTGILKERFDSNEKLMEAFNDLLNVINQEPQKETSVTGLMEAGLLSPISTSLHPECLPEACFLEKHSNCSNKIFENALEFLSLSSDDEAEN